ncbi:uncharacterized protein G2W53_001620 [Senna tora]|uniref:Uncharacterized protein n=1 Tax=Senna tora TaxID=362788 RepID=A0A834XHW0_9FABA|nr:uncharacterized protein G2W53_001620 [Senna tora]
MAAGASGGGRRQFSAVRVSDEDCVNPVRVALNSSQKLDDFSTFV